ncbi:MAG: ATP-grasp domain-containing protein [Betaproteobacteria bacterium]|nr:MAG: ATP-grasp domain-containing protein [Betaproteobacteria bacterium]
MNIYFVVNQPRDWPFETPGATVITAREYIADSNDVGPGLARVFNFCRTNRYQGRGYYVSLVAEARGHRPWPDVKTIEDLQTGDPKPLLAEGDDATSLWTITSPMERTTVINAHFGRDPARKNDAAARQLFGLLHAPFIRATFECRKGFWTPKEVRLLYPGNLDAAERAFAAEAAADYLAAPSRRQRGKGPAALAILYNADEPDPPSSPAALKAFCKTAKAMGMRAEVIGRDAIERLPEFDALFIRDTTHVNHYTYQFARRAANEGLVVIDDPDSIVRATNKVFLYELLSRHRIPLPRSLIVHRGNVAQIVATLNLPCIVKLPDSAFSRGVAKIVSREQLDDVLKAFFERSELVVAQEWLPTDFDWRVGVLDGRALYVCKYLMAPGHWQVIKREPGKKVEGATIPLTIGETPEIVVKTAVQAASVIGVGLYGVDLKQVGDRCYVIEVNDNPNIDAGNEDGVLKEALYREVLGVFLRRIRERGKPVEA